MSTYTFALDHFDAGFGARARIYIQTATGDGTGRTFITQDCAGPKEWDFVVDRLRDELENLRAQGHMMFARLDDLKTQ